LCNEILQKEVIDKELLERGEEDLAWQVVTELNRWWLYPDGVIGTRSFLEQVHGMGRSQTELQELYGRLVKFLDMTTPLLKDKLVEEAWGGNNLLRDLDYKSREYSVKEASFQEAIDKHFPEETKRDESTRSVVLTQISCINGVVETEPLVLENGVIS
jgi:hypothetical protein